jgi:hypothetical protein
VSSNKLNNLTSGQDCLNKRAFYFPKGRVYSLHVTSVAPCLVYGV